MIFFFLREIGSISSLTVDEERNVSQVKFFFIKNFTMPKSFHSKYFRTLKPGE